MHNLQNDALQCGGLVNYSYYNYNYSAISTRTIDHESISGSAYAMYENELIIEHFNIRSGNIYTLIT